MVLGRKAALGTLAHDQVGHALFRNQSARPPFAIAMQHHNVSQGPQRISRPNLDAGTNCLVRQRSASAGPCNN